MFYSTIKKTLTVALLLASSTAPVWGASPVDQVSALFEVAVASPSVPGINVAVANKEGIVWAGGFGLADVENNVPMTPEHKMRVGSVAKVFATAAMMRLVEEGAVDLDRPVGDYVPTWPEKHPAITLRQLASHTSGIRHYWGDEMLSNISYPDVTSGLAIFSDDPLLYAPGAGHSYSTYAWTLVAAALEGADGERDFRQIMADEVFGPLDMTETAFDDQYTIIPHRQRPYAWEEGQLRNAPQTDHSYKWAGGGFIASPSDVSRFAMAHLGGDYLESDTVDAMFTRATTNDGETVPFGIGWMVGYDRYRERYADNPEALELMARHPDSVMHSGGSNGGITMMILCRTHEHAVTVVKNVSGEDSADVPGLALKALDVFVE